MKKLLEVFGAGCRKVFNIDAIECIMEDPFHKECLMYITNNESFIANESYDNLVARYKNLCGPSKNDLVNTWEININHSAEPMFIKVDYSKLEYEKIVAPFLADDCIIVPCGMCSNMGCLPQGTNTCRKETLFFKFKSITPSTKKGEPLTYE